MFPGSWFSEPKCDLPNVIWNPNFYLSSYNLTTVQLARQLPTNMPHKYVSGDRLCVSNLCVLVSSAVLQLVMNSQNWSFSLYD